MESRIVGDKKTVSLEELMLAHSLAEIIHDRFGQYKELHLGPSINLDLDFNSSPAMLVAFGINPYLHSTRFEYEFLKRCVGTDPFSVYVCIAPLKRKVPNVYYTQFFVNINTLEGKLLFGSSWIYSYNSQRQPKWKYESENYKKYSVNYSDVPREYVREFKEKRKAWIRRMEEANQMMRTMT